MRACAARWLRILLLVASVAALAAELAAITDAQIAKLAQQFGPIAKERLTGWKDLLINPKYKKLSERDKLELVNDFMNQPRFVSDIDHWGKEDYWATPIEFMSTDGGDCEDFSIAKYFTLRALGVPDEKLRLIYVKELVIYRQAHMILAYSPTPDADPLVLDNINKTIQLASTRTDLLPVYSFNGSGLWLAKEQTGRAQQVGGSDRIGLWRDLQARMRAAN
ncbi:MAG: sulfate adenylyltransferase [Betaproteobacteria bacterium RIFCSPLOWO2_12_FULL_62_58]|nr:MAG: sulfate adenylyltransferase [Betaproteobacteria bacterium RIFCSPLOWO2_12_FULL_62_58]